MIAEVVRLLAGSRGAHELRELGPREYKGLAEPVTIWEVRWDSASAPRAVLPAAMSFDDDFGFVGRSRERDRLDALPRRPARDGADRGRARKLSASLGRRFCRGFLAYERDGEHCPEFELTDAIAEQLRLR